MKGTSLLRMVRNLHPTPAQSQQVPKLQPAHRSGRPGGKPPICLSAHGARIATPGSSSQGHGPSICKNVQCRCVHSKQQRRNHRKASHSQPHDKAEPSWKWLLFDQSHYSKGFLGVAPGKESACQCRRRKRHRFNPWVGKILWRRKWQLTSVLPRKLRG